MITRPVRERSAATVRSIVRAGVDAAGVSEVGLLSLSSADHSEILDIVRGVADDYEGTSTTISLPSTRVDAFNVTLADELTRGGRRTGLTFAPEAGTERLRRVINKSVSEDDMIKTAEAAYSGGWHHLKLYFMCGLPTERDEDVVGIARIADRVAEAGRSVRRRNAKVTASCGGFVPKPHTPFQWAAQDSPEELSRKLQLIKRRVAADRNLNLRYHDPLPATVEGLLARGDRRVADVVERAFVLGARFDGWSEHFDYGTWMRAAEEVGIDVAWYTRRERGSDEVFPWDHLDSGLEKDWLESDWRAAVDAGSELEDCRWTPCYDCGVCPGLDLQHQTGHLPIFSAG
jgi:radical SAM superfamily enzyme YgiQ (UPF0313 family)